MTLRIFAPAKVNLHLAVGAPGPDGYHPVETVLQTLAFGDTVTLAPGSAAFHCDPDLGLTASENLAWRAAEAMATAFERPLDAAVRVDKRVPAGAGLGGASADAAAVIVGLARLWGVPDDDPSLVRIAAGLGVDVPFFLEGGAALFTGRGDVLVRRLRPLEAAVVLVKPEQPVPTIAAYAAFDELGVPTAAPVEQLLTALAAGNVAASAAHLHNAMTASSARLVPAISDALSFVRATPGILGAAMAGSGSAVFGICEDDAAAARCAAVACEAGYWAAATRTHVGGCAVEQS